MSYPSSSEWAELTIIRCEQSKVLIELKLGSDSQGSSRIVARPDITPPFRVTSCLEVNSSEQVDRCSQC